MKVTYQMKLIYFCCILIISILFSCKSEDQSSKNTAPSIPTKTTTVAPPNHSYYVTSADTKSYNQASQDALSDEKVKKNTLVKLIEETTLTDNPNESLSKVKLLTTGTAIWIPTDNLKFFFSGANEIKNVEAIQDYYLLVTALDHTDLSSGEIALDELRKNIALDSTTNDALFFTAYDYINKLSRSTAAHGNLIANHQWTLDDYNEIISNTMDMEYHPVGRKLNKSGLTLEGALGEILVTSDIHVVSQAVGSNITTPLKKYIDMLKLSIKSKIFDNDNIIAPLTSLANQANLWSKFAVDYPNFPHISNVKMKSERLTQALLGGTKNTAAFDHKSRLTKQEYKDIWAYVLKHYNDTPLANEVRKHTQWLEGRDWKFPAEKHVH